jgi:hypothetical protein
MVKLRRPRHDDIVVGLGFDDDEERAGIELRRGGT